MSPALRLAALYALGTLLVRSLPLRGRQAPSLPEPVEHPEPVVRLLSLEDAARIAGGPELCPLTSTRYLQ